MSEFCDREKVIGSIFPYFIAVLMRKCTGSAEDLLPALKLGHL